MGEPRIRVSAVLGWRGQILLCRHEKPGKEYWLLPGGGVDGGESLTDALQRELSEELGIDDDLPVEGPVCIVDSIAPKRTLDEARRAHHLRRRPDRAVARGRAVGGRRGACGATASSRWTTSIRSSCTRRSSASCGAGGREIPLAYLAGPVWVVPYAGGRRARAES